MTENLRLLKAETAPAAIRIADHAFGVGDQNQALGMAQNLAGEITFFLQFGLRLVQA